MANTYKPRTSYTSRAAATGASALRKFKEGTANIGTESAQAQRYAMEEVRQIREKGAKTQENIMNTMEMANTQLDPSDPSKGTVGSVVGEKVVDPAVGYTTDIARGVVGTIGGGMKAGYDWAREDVGTDPDYGPDAEERDVLRARRDRIKKDMGGWDESTGVLGNIRGYLKRRKLQSAEYEGTDPQGYGEQTEDIPNVSSSASAQYEHGQKYIQDKLTGATLSKDLPSTDVEETRSNYERLMEEGTEAEKKKFLNSPEAKEIISERVKHALENPTEEESKISATSRATSKIYRGVFGGKDKPEFGKSARKFINPPPVGSSWETKLDEFQPKTQEERHKEYKSGQDEKITKIRRTLYNKPEVGAKTTSQKTSPKAFTGHTYPGHRGSETFGDETQKPLYAIDESMRTTYKNKDKSHSDRNTAMMSLMGSNTNGKSVALSEDEWRAMSDGLRESIYGKGMVEKWGANLPEGAGAIKHAIDQKTEFTNYGKLSEKQVQKKIEKYLKSYYKIVTGKRWKP